MVDGNEVKVKGRVLRAAEKTRVKERRRGRRMREAGEGAEAGMKVGDREPQK